MGVHSSSLYLRSAIAAALTAITLPAAEPATARTSTFPAVDEIVLENGFRVLVVEDRRVPRVAASLWFRVGSIGEHYGEHGSTHLLEHMMFQGTTTVGTTDFARERPIVQEIHDTEQQLIAEWNRIRNEVRERNVYADELQWPASPEAERLRRRLYELEDRQAEYREHWAEYGWYRRHGAAMRHTDPVPATTGTEHMVVEVDLPTERLELFFRLEAERLVNAVPRGFEAQRFTVLEQILNRYNRPETGRFTEALNGATAVVHPTFLSPGGHLRDFAFFTRAGILRLYDAYIVPNNATLALVGDIDRSEAGTLADRYFGRVPRSPEPPARMDVEPEPPPGGAIRLDWSESLDPRVVVRYRIPGVGHPDRPAFDTIAALLGGRGGLIARRMNRLPPSPGADFRATAARAGSIGTLDIVALLREERDAAEIENAILDTVEDLKNARIAARDLERARAALRLSWGLTRGDRGALAAELGRFQVAHDWKTLEAYLAARDAATTEAIARLAERYLVSTNRVIATTRRVPEALPRRPASPTPLGPQP